MSIPAIQNAFRSFVSFGWKSHAHHYKTLWERENTKAEADWSCEVIRLGFSTLLKHSLVQTHNFSFLKLAQKMDVSLKL